MTGEHEGAFSPCDGWDGYPAEAWDRPSLALCVSDGHGLGIVLFAAGPHVRFEIDAASPFLDELGLDGAPFGVSVWEGAYVPWASPNADVDADLSGAFRPLTDAEWQSVRKGEPPWDDNDWRRPGP